VIAKESGELVCPGPILLPNLCLGLAAGCPEGLPGKAVIPGTSRHPQGPWANATVVDGGLVEFVRDLKQQRGGDVGVHASISVAQALLAADVVDELRLVIGPMIVGRGRRLLDGLPSIQLELIRSEISPTGYLLVDYRVIR
jgi:dihydrofolate reductase